MIMLCNCRRVVRATFMISFHLFFLCLDLSWVKVGYYTGKNTFFWPYVYFEHKKNQFLLKWEN